MQRADALAVLAEEHGMSLVDMAISSPNDGGYEPPELTDAGLRRRRV